MPSDVVLPVGLRGSHGRELGLVSTPVAASPKFWRHYFRCLGQTSNPKLAGHRGESYTGEVVTPSPQRPRFPPICSGCVEAMEYVGTGEGEHGHAPHFSKLDPHEHELLAHLAEELAEAGQEAAKILIHGLGSRHPDQPGVSNRDRLATELGHVAAAVDMLVQLDVVDSVAVQRGRDEKFRRAGRWLHHVAISGGTVAVIRRDP